MEKIRWYLRHNMQPPFGRVLILFPSLKNYVEGEVVDISCTVSYLTTYLQIFDVRGFVMTLGDSMTCFLVVMGN